VERERDVVKIDQVRVRIFRPESVAREEEKNSRFSTRHEVHSSIHSVCTSLVGIHS
jgi:hypothetical protein